MKKTSLLLGTACSTLLACTSLAFAQDNSTPTPIQGISKSTGGTGTIAAAMAKKIPLKSPFAASHISKAEIDQKSPAATMDSILNTEPSINATSSGPLGVQQNITFRAFNSSQFSQTWDGISLNDIFQGGSTNAYSVSNNVLLTPMDIEGVDLYRGINNPATNGYFSLGGTINYDPVEPSDKAGASITGNYGSFDTIGYNAIVNTGKVDGFKNVMAFSHESSNGWLKGDDDTNSNFYDAFSQDTGSTGKIYGNFVYNENHGETAYDVPQYLVQEYGRDFQFPKSIYNNPVNDTNYLAIFGTTQALNDFTTFDIKGFFGTDNFYRNAYSNPAYQATGFYVPNGDVNLGTSKKPNEQDTTYYGNYGHEVGVQPKVTFDLPYNIITVGGNYTLGHLHSDEFVSNSDPVLTRSLSNELWEEHDTRTIYSAYMQDEIDLLNDKLKITPGVKYLYANTKSVVDPGSKDYALGGSVSGTSHYTSPTAGVSYEFLPNTVIYGAYGQNVQFPTINAYYGNVESKGVEPIHLEPEHVDDYEAGLRYRNNRLGFNSALGFYLENFTNTFITATDPTTGLSTVSNGGSSQYKGIELQLAEDFGHKHIKNTDIGDFTSYVNYSYNHAVFTSNFAVSSVGNSIAQYGTVTKGTPLALVPQDIVNFGGSWSLDGWGANADARYVTSQFIKQAGAGTTSNLQEPAYFTLNLGFSKTIPVHFGAAQSLKFQFNIDNVLDRAYDAYAYAETESVATGAASPYNSPLAKGAKSVSYASVQEAAPRAFYGSVTLSF